MPYLNLGVVDLPYQYAKATKRMAHARKGKAARPRPGPQYDQSTVDVARILEAKYHIMAIFFREHGREIAGYMADDMIGAMFRLKNTGLQTFNLGVILAEAMSKTEDRFRKFLYMKEMDRLAVPGVPTMASIIGISHRFKNRRGPPNRPSFIDTGLYESAFRAWVTLK